MYRVYVAGAPGENPAQAACSKEQATAEGQASPAKPKRGLDRVRHRYRCMYCGITGVKLVPDGDFNQRLRCAPDLPCTADSNYQKRLKPNCPQCCVETHEDVDADRALETGGWNHNTAKFKMTVHEPYDELGDSDQFYMHVNTWEHLGGDFELVSVGVTTSVLDMYMTPVQAEEFADLLGAAAQIALTGLPNTSQPVDLSTTTAKAA